MVRDRRSCCVADVWNMCFNSSKNYVEPGGALRQNAPRSTRQSDRNVFLVMVSLSNESDPRFRTTHGVELAEMKGAARKAGVGEEGFKDTQGSGKVEKNDVRIR